MSFLPGLGLTNPTSTTNLDPSERPTKTITLQAGSEYRFEVPASTTVTITVLLESAASLDTPTGTAEVFGTELAPNHPYDFLSLTKAAIYTHHGCSLSVTGTCDSDYVAEETPMTEYANVHFALETMRQADNAMGGPRVLVVGPKDSGKTTLIRTLTAYATRTSRTPVVVNLDPSEGMLCLPGSVSAAVFGTGATLDPEDAASSGWGSSPVGGPSPTPVKTPLVYHCGFERAEERAEVFKPVVTRLALAATSRFEEDPMVKRSGLLVDVGGSLGRSEGYDVLAHIVGELSINVILVLGSERLYSDMHKRFGSSNTSDEQVHIIKLSKSGGCVDRDDSYMRQLRQAQIRSYFFGGAKSALSPVTMGVDFDAIKVLRFVEPTKHDPMASSFLPGTDDDVPSTHVRSWQALYESTPPTVAMHNALLVLKHTPQSSSSSQDGIRDAPVIGYVYVADVEEKTKKLRLLSPVGGRLPPGPVVWGTWDGGLAVGMGGMLGG